MTEGVKKANSPSSKENETSSGGNPKKKTKGEKFPTKVVVRKLPPSMTLETFLENVSPLPDYDYINFVPADNSLFPFNFSRAYINFINQEDLLIFTQKFDNYVFVDSKGHEYPALVEFAPFQRIPKSKANKKKDSKCNTIEDDADYVKFKDRLQAEEEENESGKHNVFETTLPEDIPEKVTSTPLLDFLRKKREEKKRIREEKKEERRKRDLERRKLKDEQRKAKKAGAVVPASAATQSEAAEATETSVTSSATVTKDKERVKEKDKRGAKDLLKAIKVKEKLNSVSNREKEKGGKSYREERMRRLEQREELKKNSKTSDTSETTNQESNGKDKKMDDSSSQEPVEDKYKKQKLRTESYQKNKRKEYEKRPSEYYKSKSKDYQNDRSKKKLLIAQKPQDESNISENKENNSNCDKKDETKEAGEKQSVKKIGNGSQKDPRNSEAKAKESGAVPKRRKSIDTQSKPKPSNSVKKKKDDEKEESKNEASNASSKPRTENPSSEKTDSKKISKSETLARRNTTEDESATSPVATLERRKSLESQAAPTKSGESQTKKDPRVERRIRNKDRPALEIYRPGMGKFSKQRLEKVLGSSTERDTPSPSPSITSN